MQDRKRLGGFCDGTQLWISVVATEPKREFSP
jgi:hypothetical protein